MSCNTINLQDYFFTQNRNPRCLYKFRHWGNEEHESVLKDNYLHFASPNSLNDPFDCDVQYTYNNLKKENLKWFYKNENFTCKNNEDLKLLIQKLKTDKKYVINEIQKDSFMYINKTSGICSLSATYKNLLLWSHYANNHTGWALGLNFKKLDDYIQSTKQHLLSKNNYYLLQFKVVYYRQYLKYEFFDIHRDNDNDPTLTLHRFGTKGVDWKYEKEYRLVMFSPFQEIENRNWYFPDAIIDKIILGCKMSETDEEEIKEVLRKKPIKIPLYKADKKPYGFGLILKREGY